MMGQLDEQMMDGGILGKWMEGQWNGWMEGWMIGCLMEEWAMRWL